MDEMAQAFELPIARAQNTAGADPLDRISVRDYTRDVEIGAFQAERGVTQRIRFNIVLEVSRHAAAATDDVDQVLSYDTITEAINAQLKAERINLLETLAERVAERVLHHKQAVRIFVRIEKLDRIPGTLGVEIARSRIEPGQGVTRIKAEASPVEALQHPLVVFLPNDVLHGPDLAVWLDAIAGHDAPAILCVEDPEIALPKAGATLANRRISLLGIEQNAWVLAGKDPRCVVSTAGPSWTGRSRTASFRSGRRQKSFLIRSRNPTSRVSPASNLPAGSQLNFRIKTSSWRVARLEMPRA